MGWIRYLLRYYFNTGSFLCQFPVDNEDRRNLLISMKQNVFDELDRINAVFLTYKEWQKVGMALKSEGYSCKIWDEWSQGNPLYHAGECIKEWETFSNSTDTPATETLIRSLEWKYTRAAKRDMPMDWDDEIECDDDYNSTSLTECDDIYTSIINYNDVNYSYNILTEPGEKNSVEELKAFLCVLFKPDDIIGYVTNDVWKDEEGHWNPGKGVYTRTAGEILYALMKHPDDLGAAIDDWKLEAGAWIRFNPLDGKGIKDENVTEFRFALVESDTIPVEEQEETLRSLRLPIATLTYSGGKSLHAIVRIDASDRQQYKERVQKLYDYIENQGISIDPQNRNPSRLTRMPGVTRNGRTQYLVATNIGCRTWSDWENYTEERRQQKNSRLTELPDPQPILVPQSAASTTGVAQPAKSAEIEGLKNIEAIHRIPDEYLNIPEGGGPAGGRNNSITRLAAWLFRAYGDNPNILSTMLTVNKEYQPPLSENEIQGIYERSRKWAQAEIWSDPKWKTRSEYVADRLAEQHGWGGSLPNQAMSWEDEIQTDSWGKPETTENKAADFQKEAEADQPHAEKQADSKSEGAPAGTDENIKSTKYMEWQPVKPLTAYTDETVNQNVRYPVESFPQIQRDYLEAVSENYHVDPAMAGMWTLVSYATAYQKVFTVSPDPSWDEQLSIWGILVADPSVKKSPVMNEYTKHIDIIQEEKNEALKPKILSWETRYEIAQAKADQARKALRSPKESKSANRDEAKADLENALRTIKRLEDEKPYECILLAEDTTSEALIRTMSQQGGRITIMSDEKGALQTQAGKYNNQVADVSFHLKAFSGSDASRNTMKNGLITVQKAALSQGFAIHPEDMKDLLKNKDFARSGYLARCLITYPIRKIAIDSQGRPIHGKPIDPAVNAAFHEDLEQAFCLSPQKVREDSFGGLAKKCAIVFSEEAIPTWDAWIAEIERMKMDTDSNTMLDWLGKAAGYTARIAALLHCMRMGRDSAAEIIPESTIRDAIALMRYYIAGARRTFEPFEEPSEIKDALYLWKKLHSFDKDKVTKRDLYKKNCHRKFNEPGAMDSGLKTLWRYGYITMETPPSNGGRRPSTIIHINQQIREI